MGSVALCQDKEHIITNEHGSVPLVPNTDAGTDTPQDLIGGGEHFDDMPRDARRDIGNGDDQRRALLQQVIDSHLTRPRRVGL